MCLFAGPLFHPSRVQFQREYGRRGEEDEYRLGTVSNSELLLIYLVIPMMILDTDLGTT